MTEFHQFSFSFDESKLLHDLQICQQTDWVLHYNQNDYTGSWSSFSLRSISGKETDALASINATYQDTPALQKCSYFKEIIDSFACKKEAIRLLSLAPKSYIKEHCDNASGYEDGFFRIHIPIQTNDHVIFRLNGNILPMKVGECWYANFNLPHYVSNDGNAARIHLVLDCLRNEWSDKLFESIGYDFETEKIKKYDKNTILMMIEQLALINTETAHKIIAEFKAELADE